MVRRVARRFGLTMGVVLVTACAFQEPDCTDNIEGADASFDATSGPYSPECNACQETCACEPGTTYNATPTYGCPPVVVCDESGFWHVACEGEVCDASSGRADATEDDAEGGASDGDALGDGPAEGESDATDE